MEEQALGLAVAFTAGLLSFLSPCVLPLIPSYATFLTGMTLDELTVEDRDRQARLAQRRAVLTHGGMFVLGFSAVFIALGASATFIGAALQYYGDWVQRVGGVLLILFGLYMIGAFRFAAASREWRYQFSNRPAGYAGSALVGVAFGAGWTPCIGPVLGGILTLAATSDSIGAGIGLLSVYSLGLAVPFLAAALLLDRFLTAFRRFRRWIPWVERVSGALLILVGILLVTGTFTMLSSMLARWTPSFILERL